MNKLSALILAAAIAAPLSASAWDLKDLGGTVSNLVEGVFTKSDLDLKDLAGVWTSDGSAVCFKSQNALQKAGGTAIAAAVESQIDPYYKKFGLDGAVFTIQTDGSFTLKTKMVNFNGNISKNSDGTFNFAFKALGMNAVNITAYVQKPPKKLEIMFDASKLKTLLVAVTKITGSKLINTAGSILDKYDGLCVGFSLDKTGDVDGSDDSSAGSMFDGLLNGGSSRQPANQTTKSGSKSSATKGVNDVINILKNKGK